MSSNGQGGGDAPVPAKKEKKASDKDLDLANANRGVWLVKVPKYIADRWESAADSSEVGTLSIARGRNPAGKPAISFTLSEQIVAARAGEAAKEEDAAGSSRTQKQIPRKHKFLVNSVAAQSLAVLSHTAGDPEALVPTPDRLALEGTVVQRGECRPIQDNLYMDIKKEALLKAIEPVRQTLQLDKAVVAYKPKSNHQSNIQFDLKRKAEGKKARDDKEKVMETLFALFEKHQYYNIKDLVKETRQPVTYLKEILKEVCNYNLKNPHKNMWELKPEYRHYKQEEKKEENKDDSSSDDD